MAYALKYRPQKFDELDQDRVRSFFTKILKQGKFSQAYLFTGPKGTGKTSTARVLAMCLNCEGNVKLQATSKQLQAYKEPCGECDSCRSIRMGNSPAVIEIDAASNRGIDDIRQLRERVGLLPTSGNKTVYIIDEVHMLTKEAFNALLKTLEEPPRHVVFCLCTTEEHKVIGTIASRCLRVSYQKANAEEIARSLDRIVKGEGLKVDEGVTQLIAQAADGSFRDAAKLLEQAVSAMGKKVEISGLEEVLGGGWKFIDQMYETVLAGEAQKAMKLAEKIVDGGVDPGLVVKQVISRAVTEIKTLVIETDQTDSQLVRLVEVFSKAYSRFSQVPIAELPLNMAIVEYCVVESENQKSKTTSQNDRLKVEIDKAKTEASDEEQNASNEKAGKKKVSTEIEKEAETEGGGRAEEKDEVDRTVSDESKDNGLSEVNSDSKDKVELVLEEVKAGWSKVLEEVEKQNHGLVTLLKQARLRDCADGQVLLGVSYKFHKEQLEQDRYMTVVEEVLMELLGSKVRVLVEVDEVKTVPKKMKEHENISAAIPDEDKELLNAAEEAFGL